MYFIKAEARAAESDYTGVANALKQITDRRFVTPPALLVLTTDQQAWKAILDERRKELAFEGHRFIDLKINCDSKNEMKIPDDLLDDITKLGGNVTTEYDADTLFVFVRMQSGGDDI